MSFEQYYCGLKTLDLSILTDRVKCSEAVMNPRVWIIPDQVCCDDMTGYML